MLRLTTLTAIALVAAHPALAAAPVQYGEGEGERFQYTTELRANGFIRIAGVLLDSKVPFVLDVSPTGHVDGNFGNTAVDYNVRKSMRDAVAAELQSPALADASQK